jgi:hypothetical protein
MPLFIVADCNNLRVLESTEHREWGMGNSQGQVFYIPALDQTRRIRWTRRQVGKTVQNSVRLSSKNVVFLKMSIAQNESQTSEILKISEV